MEEKSYIIKILASRIFPLINLQIFLHTPQSSLVVHTEKGAKSFLQTCSVSVCFLLTFNYFDMERKCKCTYWEAEKHEYANYLESGDTSYERCSISSGSPVSKQAGL